MHVVHHKIPGGKIAENIFLRMLPLLFNRRFLYAPVNIIRTQHEELSRWNFKSIGNIFPADRKRGRHFLFHRRDYVKLRKGGGKRLRLAPRKHAHGIAVFPPSQQVLCKLIHTAAVFHRPVHLHIHLAHRFQPCVFRARHIDDIGVFVFNKRPQLAHAFALDRKGVAFRRNVGDHIRKLRQDAFSLAVNPFKIIKQEEGVRKIIRNICRGKHHRQESSGVFKIAVFLHIRHDAVRKLFVLLLFEIAEQLFLFLFAQHHLARRRQEIFFRRFSRRPLGLAVKGADAFNFIVKKRNAQRHFGIRRINIKDFPAPRKFPARINGSHAFISVPGKLLH
ncbi:MAG: hypothetical protein DELT_03028 [Desulfovibrio sp.]